MGIEQGDAWQRSCNQGCTEACELGLDQDMCAVSSWRLEPYPRISQIRKEGVWKAWDEFNFEECDLFVGLN